MQVFVALGGRRPRWSGMLIGFALGFALATSAAQANDRANETANDQATAPATEQPPAPSVGGTLAVHLDETAVVKLPERTTTLVVGNPLIADASVQPGGLLVITGKSHGATNLVALDRYGALLMEHSVQVLGPRDAIVVVYRGVERESYSCAPTCQRRITLGDSVPYFQANLAQAVNRSTQALGAAQQR